MNTNHTNRTNNTNIIINPLMGLLLFAEYKRYLLNPACMQAYIQSFSNIFIPYRNLIPSKKFTMIGVREGWSEGRVK